MIDRILFHAHCMMEGSRQIGRCIVDGCLGKQLTLVANPIDNAQ